jgi:hypothetical protein
MGLLKDFLQQPAEETESVSVTGKIIDDRAINRKVVEVVMTLREITSRNYAGYPPQITSGPTAYPFAPPVTGVQAYGAPLMVATECGTTTRSEPKRNLKNNNKKPKPKSNLNAPSSSAAASSTPAPSSTPIAGPSTRRATPIRDTPGSQGDPIVVDEQGSSWLTRCLTDIATRLAQVRPLPTFCSSINKSSQVDAPEKPKPIPKDTTFESHLKNAPYFKNLVNSGSGIGDISWLEDTPLVAAALARLASSKPTTAPTPPPPPVVVKKQPALRESASLPASTGEGWKRESVLRGGKGIFPPPPASTMRAPLPHNLRDLKSKVQSKPVPGPLAPQLGHLTRDREKGKARDMAMAIPSSDPVAPSSPTPGARSLRSLSGSGSAIGGSGSGKGPKYYRSPAKPLVAVKGHAYYRSVSQGSVDMDEDAEMESQETQSQSQSQSQSAAEASGSQSQPQPHSSTTLPTVKKKKKPGLHDENAAPTPSTTSINIRSILNSLAANSSSDPPEKRRRAESPGRSEEERANKKIRNALGSRDENSAAASIKVGGSSGGAGTSAPQGVGIGPALPARPSTPPPTLGVGMPSTPLRTPRASSAPSSPSKNGKEDGSLDDPFRSLFTPSPRKAPGTPSTARLLTSLGVGMSGGGLFAGLGLTPGPAGGAGLALTPGRGLDTMPSTGFTPLFGSAIKHPLGLGTGLTPQAGSSGGMGMVFGTPTRGGKGSAGFSGFEDGGAGLNMGGDMVTEDDWFNFGGAFQMSLLNGQFAAGSGPVTVAGSDVAGSSTGAEAGSELSTTTTDEEVLAAASSDGAHSTSTITETQSVLSLSSSRWADLPPSSPPPPSSPVQLSSDLDVDIQDTPTSSQLATDEELPDSSQASTATRSRSHSHQPQAMDEDPTPTPSSAHSQLTFEELEALELQLDSNATLNVNPAELFASLGFQIADMVPNLTGDASDDAFHLLKNINFDDPAVLEGLENYRGCVL